MINIELNENDLFKIILGSTQNRVELLLCESMMEKIDFLMTKIAILIYLQV